LASRFLPRHFGAETNQLPQDKENTMSIKPLSLRVGALALLVSATFVATERARADSVAPMGADRTSMESMDMSTPHRHHHARRSTVRDAYGAYVGDEMGIGVPSPQPYGYGVGDNSHDQTW
jgi:hypothetical protein